MQDDDHAPDAQADENRVLRSMQASLAMLATGVAASREPVEQLARDRKRHLEEAVNALGDAARLPSDQKPSAASNVVFGETQNAVKDLGAAAFRAMASAGAAARRARDEMRKNPCPFGMAEDEGAGANPFSQSPSDDNDFNQIFKSVLSTDPSDRRRLAEFLAKVWRDQRAGKPADASDAQLEQRHFAVQLSGGPLEEGCAVFVSCSLVLRAPTDARTATAVANVDPTDPEVVFVCTAEGFSLESDESLTAKLRREGDTRAVVFMLKVQKANRYRITITAHQRGVIRGQLVVDDPAAYLPQAANGGGEIGSADPHPLMVGELTQPGVEPSLWLELYDPPRNIVGTSPYNILDWTAQDLGNWRGEAADAFDIVQKHVAGLYANPPAADKIDREFLILGDRIAKVIPARLAHALEDPRLDFLALQVTAGFDFPLDLCKVETPHEQLVQDRMAVSRWFANTRAIKFNWTHRVSDIALVVGKMTLDATVENQAFDPTAPARYTIFKTHRGLIDEVFKTDRFNLMHYFGHSGRGEEEGPEMGRYLSLAEDGLTLRLQEIGTVRTEREFFTCNPLIVLNCCDGVQPSALLGGPDSFPHRFIDNACVACVGSIWPIDSRAGNRFVTALYAHLAKGEFLHEAVRNARNDLLDHATNLPNEKVALTLAARAYVYYGPPDLRCTFVGRDP